MGLVNEIQRYTKSSYEKNRAFTLRYYVFKKQVYIRGQQQEKGDVYQMY